MKILQLVEVIVTYMFRKVTVQEKNLDLKKVVQQFWGSIEYKISFLKESVEFITDRVNQKSSEFLEWIIIWLIVIEVLFSTYEYIIKPLL